MNRPIKELRIQEGERFVLYYDDIRIVDESMAASLIRLQKSSFQHHLKFTSSALKSLSIAGVTDENDIESATIFIQLASLAKGYR